MAAVVSIAGVEFPFLPRHLTLVRTLSVGIPGLVLALAPDSRRDVPASCPGSSASRCPRGSSLVPRRWWSLRCSSDRGVLADRVASAATVTLLGVGLGLLVRLTETLPRWRWLLVAAMAAATALAIVVDPIAEFFALAHPPAALWWVIAVVLLVAQVAIRFVPVPSDDETGTNPGSGPPATTGERTTTHDDLVHFVPCLRYLPHIHDT